MEQQTNRTVPTGTNYYAVSDLGLTTNTGGSGTATFILPSIATLLNFREDLSGDAIFFMYFQYADLGTGTLTIQAAAGDLINGSATLVISGGGSGQVTLSNNNTTWTH